MKPRRSVLAVGGGMFVLAAASLLDMHRLPPDTAAARSASSAASAQAANGGDVQTPEQVANDVGYADMDAEDLEDLIPMLDAVQLSALSRHERDLGDRPAFRTLLDNALRG